MATRFYLHNASSGISGTLPSAEQSTLTSANDFEANQATNRDMSRFKGTSATTLSNTSTATVSQTSYYVARWVSPLVNQTSIAANTWTVNATFWANNANSCWPINSNSGAGLRHGYVNCYVWKPSDGTKYGTILDGDTGDLAAGQSTSGRDYQYTFSGSAVSSLTANDAVIVFEIWFKITQLSATAYTQNMSFDGPTIRADGDTTGTNTASFLQTPENIILVDTYSEVKLYFHNTTSGLPSGTLPSAEQSTNTVTSACNFEGSQTTNRLMNSTIGTSQATLSLTSPAAGGSYTYYVSRWVSPVIYQTSVDAGTWTYNFAARESGTTGNFPVTSSNKAVWVNCYVWKPSNGTKYGTILDGNSAATASEGGGALEVSQQVDFTGSAVSSLTSGDACIVFEVWFVVAPTGGFLGNDFFYDGTTETNATGTTVSNHASYIMTQGMALSFTAGGTLFTRALSTETISISESLAEIYNANRAPTAEIISIGESQARAFTGIRVLTAETVTVGESITRLYGANRAPTTETVSIGESLARLFGANRSLTDTTAISEAIAKVQVLVRSLSDTTAISESLTKILTLVRNLSTETIAISESITRVFVGIRAISETNTIGESLSRLKAATRTLSTETVTIGESVVRVFGVLRSLSPETTVIGESLFRVLGTIRALSDTNAISESLAKAQVLVRSLSDTGAISESLARVLGINRSLSDTTTIGESLSRVLGAIRALATQITTIGESLVRIFGAVRTLSDTTIISENLARLIAVIRSLSDTTTITGIVDSLYTPVGGGAINYNRALSDTIAISESLTRSISNMRSLIETIVIGESLNRLTGLIRLLSDNTIISESLSRLVALTRSLSDSTTINESLSRVYGVIRNISDSTAISESLNKILALTRSLSDTTILSESLSRIVGLTRVLLDTTIINELLTRVYGIVKSLSDTVIISDSIARLANMIRSLTQSVIILESLRRTIIGIIVDYVPSLETDFTNYIDEMILPYIFAKWNATGQLLKGNDMIDANSPIEFKIGIHSSRPYQVLVLEHQTEINKLSINKFGGGISQFYTIIEVTVMVQRLQRDIPIELSQMEKEIQRIVCHYRRNEIMGIDDLILVGMRREFTGRKKDWSKSIWSTKIYFKAEYLKVNTEVMI